MTDTEVLVEVISKHHLYASDDEIGPDDNCQCGHDLTAGGLLESQTSIEWVHDAHLAEVLIHALAVDACTSHHPIQHRDGKPPWCKTCGRTQSGAKPVSRFEQEAPIGRE